MASCRPRQDGDDQAAGMLWCSSGGGRRGSSAQTCSGRRCARTGCHRTAHRPVTVPGIWSGSAPPMSTPGSEGASTWTVAHRIRRATAGRLRSLPAAMAAYPRMRTARRFAQRGPPAIGSHPMAPRTGWRGHRCAAPQVSTVPVFRAPPIRRRGDFFPEPGFALPCAAAGICPSPALQDTSAIGPPPMTNTPRLPDGGRE